ncbi:MAG: hypothetical protein HXS43_13555 [Theionarchaea archaeon]|nr:hypothetical protein [Theionarchaea archaeon]
MTEYRRGMSSSEQSNLVISLVKDTPGITKKEIHEKTGMPMRTLHRRARELHLQGSLLVKNGHLTCSTGESGIQVKIENPVFELKERVSPDIIDKGVEWLSIKAFFGLHKREVTIQDDGVTQRIVISTGESLGIKDYHDLWRLLKEAFRTPVVCSDYQIVVQGCNVISLETPQDLVSLLSSLDKTLNLVRHHITQ